MANLAAGGAFLGGAALKVVGFWSGALVGAAGGFASGFSGAALNTWFKGGTLGDGLASGFKAGVQGALIGAAVGGVTGGLRAKNQGLDFWSGKPNEVGGIAGKQRTLVFDPDTNGETLTNPTNGDIRISDGHGEGFYGAPRRGNSHHLGLDINSTPGQQVVSPIDGKATIFRSSSNNGSYTANIIPSASKSGIEKIQILYLDKPTSSLGQAMAVKAGEPLLSTAGKLTNFGYSTGVTNHIHVQIFQNGLRVNPAPFFFPSVSYPIYTNLRNGWSRL